jgi:hypothetical protein
MKTYVHLWQYLAVSFVKLEVFQNCRENQNTHYMFSNLFFPESGAVCEIMWKKTVEPERSQMTIHCMLDKQGYKNTVRIGNTLFFHGKSAYVSVPQWYVYTYTVST